MFGMILTNIAELIDHHFASILMFARMSNTESFILIRYVYLVKKYDIELLVLNNITALWS